MRTTYGMWRQEGDDVLGFPPTALAGGGGLVLLMIPLLAHSWVLLGVFGPPAVLLGAAALIRVQGRLVLSWMGVVGRYAMTEVVVGTAFAAPNLTRTENASGEAVDSDEWELPGILHPLRHLAAQDDAGRLVAILAYPPTGIYSMVASVRHSGTALLDEEDLDRRVAGWGALLASECEEDGLARISVYEHIDRGEGGELGRWIDQHLARGVPAQATEMVKEMARADRTLNTSRRTWVVIGVEEARARREIRGFGGGDEGARRILVRRARAVAARLSTIGLELDHWVDPTELFSLVRQSYDPAYRGEADLGGAPLRAREAGPNVAKAKFGSYCHDGYESVTWELGWSESPRQASVLAGLLGGDGVSRRALALHCEPLPRSRAMREIGSARTKAEVAREVGRRTGRLERASARRARAITERQDAALAEGAGIVRFTGFVTATVPVGGDLDGAVAGVRNDAGFGGIRVLRCAGWMDSAFAAGVVPVGGLSLGKRKVLG
jgi:hypothetical protein